MVLGVGIAIGILAFIGVSIGTLTGLSIMYPTILIREIWYEELVDNILNNNQTYYVEYKYSLTIDEGREFSNGRPITFNYTISYNISRDCALIRNIGFSHECIESSHRCVIDNDCIKTSFCDYTIKQCTPKLDMHNKTGCIRHTYLDKTEGVCKNKKHRFSSCEYDNQCMSNNCKRLVSFCY